MDMDMQFLLSAGCPIFLEENLAKGGDRLLGGGLDTLGGLGGLDTSGLGIAAEFNPASL